MGAQDMGQGVAASPGWAVGDTKTPPTSNREPAQMGIFPFKPELKETRLASVHLSSLWPPRIGDTWVPEFWRGREWFMQPAQTGADCSQFKTVLGSMWGRGGADPIGQPARPLSQGGPLPQAAEAWTAQAPAVVVPEASNSEEGEWLVTLGLRSGPLGLRCTCSLQITSHASVLIRYEGAGGGVWTALPGPLSSGGRNSLPSETPGSLEDWYAQHHQAAFPTQD